MTYTLKPLRGLPDLRDDRENIGVVVAAGIKGKTGAPEQSDCLHLLTPKAARRKARSRAGKEYNIDARAHHPDFRAWNDRESEDKRSLKVLLCFPNEEAFWWPGYRAPRAIGPGSVSAPFKRGLWCHGNGKAAQRWTAGACEVCGGSGRLGRGPCARCKSTGGGYSDIPCPGESCPFRQEHKDRRGNAFWPCGRAATIYFQLRWPEAGPLAGLPTYQGKLHTRGREAVDSFYSLMAKTRNLAKELQVDFTWMWMPFVISVGREANDRGVFTVLGFSHDQDVTQWLLSQRQILAQLRAAEPVALLGATSEAEREPAEMALDAATISADPLVKPAATAKPEEAEAKEAGRDPPGKPTNEGKKTRAGKEAWIESEAGRLHLPLPEMVSEVRGGEGAVDLDKLTAEELEDLGAVVKKEVLAAKARQGQLPLGEEPAP